MYDCEICSRDFPNRHATRLHKDALGHWVCYGCGDLFDTQDVLEAHEEDHFNNPDPKYGCETCSDRFYTRQEAIDHMNALNHWHRFWCRVCEKGFQNPNNSVIHLRSKAHRDKSNPFKCETCPARFASFHQAQSHMEALNHWHDNYCVPCAWGFQNRNALRMHLKSKAHLGSPITCPFCTHPFTTATGLIHHLETGSCLQARDLNRETLLEQIRRRNPHHVITKKIIEYMAEEPDITIVSPECWNGYGFECYICHREFSTSRGLEQHVRSSVHEQKVYHCLGRGCGREFATLAGLFNHLESECCGAVRFEAVQRGMGDIILGRRAIAFR